MPLLEVVPQEGQARVEVEEPSEAVSMGGATFEGPSILFMQPGTSGIWRCMSRCKMRKPIRESFCWMDYSTVLATK